METRADGNRFNFAGGTVLPFVAQKLSNALRLVGWNAATLIAGLVLIGLVGELWLRSTVPFRKQEPPRVFVPEVGVMLPPNTEVRWTNGLDFWTQSRTNSLGFLDREPPSPKRAARSCHITMLGDSFVAAREVPIADKLQVQLEALAAQQLPHLKVSTSAFGRGTTGQINQLPFYDEYARRLRPKLLVLVFVDNDFMDNSMFLDLFSIRWRLDPKFLPFVYAQRGVNGTIELRPPDPHWASRVPQPHSTQPWASRILQRVAEDSYLAGWLDAKMSALSPAEAEPELIAWLESLGSRPGYETLFDAWRPTARTRVNDEFEKENPPPVFKEALAFTAFALDQFKQRTERDGVALAILATHRMGQAGGRLLSYMNAMAEARGIPVIDQYDYILRQGGNPRNANWVHDAHWNRIGHRWAAQALFEYLKRNQWICGDAAETETQPFASARNFSK